MYLIINEFGECTFVNQLTESNYAASNRGEITIVNYSDKTYHCNSEWTPISLVEKVGL